MVIKILIKELFITKLFTNNDRQIHQMKFIQTLPQVIFHKLSMTKRVPQKIYFTTKLELMENKSHSFNLTFIIATLFQATQ